MSITINIKQWNLCRNNKEEKMDFSADLNFIQDFSQPYKKFPSCRKHWDIEFSSDTPWFEFHQFRKTHFWVLCCNFKPYSLSENIRKNWIFIFNFPTHSPTADQDIFITLKDFCLIKFITYQNIWIGIETHLADQTTVTENSY